MSDNSSEKQLKPMLAYSAANLPAGLILLVVGAWLMRLYCPSSDEDRVMLITDQMFGVITFMVTVVAGFTDFFIGYFSDRTKTTLGRRTPYIMIGLPFLALSFLLVWFPPVSEGCTPMIPAEGHPYSFLLSILPVAYDVPMGNILWLLFLLGCIHISFTVVVNPYLALMPELWRSAKGRIRVSAWMAAFNAIAQVVGLGVFGILISKFSGGITLFGIDFPDGYKLGAVICFVLTIAGFVPLFVTVREAPYTKDKQVPFGLWESAVKTLTNPAFLPYIGAGAMLMAAQSLILLAIPYLMVTQVVEDPNEGDGAAAMLLLGLVVFSAALYPVAVKLADRYRKRDLMMASLASFVIVLPLVTLAGRIPFISAWVHVIVACALITPGLAVGMVIPRAILADVMDHDAERTGFRREAMYNGMEGLIQKIAYGLAPLAAGFLFANFGKTQAEPWGIVLCGVAAGIMAVLGMVAFKFYPLNK
ncbi:MAG: MFS transporter [Deltaproteobacteria bacterium]|nr:MFS transporter [Deltaproteobacteria bacterium]